MVENLTKIVLAMKIASEAGIGCELTSKDCGEVYALLTGVNDEIQQMEDEIVFLQTEIKGVRKTNDILRESNIEHEKRTLELERKVLDLEHELSSCCVCGARPAYHLYVGDGRLFCKQCLRDVSRAELNHGHVPMSVIIEYVKNHILPLRRLGKVPEEE